jgi:glycosidase
MRENPALYEINTYVWLYELSQQYGEPVTIGNVPAAEWDRFKALGCDYIWLMGIWKRSMSGFRIFQDEAEEYIPFISYINSIFPGWKEEDLVGSPYSVAAYEPDPFIGKWEDVDKAMEELHKRDMGLILDFVPNHTAPDHPWVFEHPDYYFQGNSEEFEKHPGVFSLIKDGERIIYAARGKDPYFPSWSDTVQLNHFNRETRKALINEVKKIAEHCDGIRCDMAMLVLNDIFQNTWGWMRKLSSQALPEEEFWVKVRQAIPGSLLMAETYWDTEWTLQQMGFDYVYDKKLYDRIASFSSGDIYLHLKADMNFQKRLIRFLENHDEKRSAEVFGKERLETVATLFSTLPGMRLYHQGQIEGKKLKISVQLRRITHEAADKEVKAFYERLLSITKQDVFHNGKWRLWEVYPLSDGSSGNLIAYTWVLGHQIKIVVINMSPSVSQGRIPLRDMVRSDSEYILTDELHGITYIRNGKDMENPGLIVILDSFKSHIFDIALPSGEQI